MPDKPSALYVVGDRSLKINVLSSFHHDHICVFTVREKSGEATVYLMYLDHDRAHASLPDLHAWLLRRLHSATKIDTFERKTAALEASVAEKDAEIDGLLRKLGER